MKVAILAKGKSIRDFPGREGFDEVWGLNQIGQSHDLDRLFVMDDLNDRLPHYNGPEFPEWLKTYPGRLITSRALPDWPTSEAYPITEVARSVGGMPLAAAFYSTPDYMIALAIHERVRELWLYGVDCRSPLFAEVQASIALWLGFAMARGIRVVTTPLSAFQAWTNGGYAMDHGLYGYVEKPRIEHLAGVATEAA